MVSRLLYHFAPVEVVAGVVILLFSGAWRSALVVWALAALTFWLARRVERKEAAAERRES